MRPRAIPSARVIPSGEIVIADEVLHPQKGGHEFRLAARKNGETFECLDCGQRLFLPRSAKMNLYFRHGPNTGACRLEGAFSREELRIFDLENRMKESPRHRELKEKLAERLLREPGVRPESIRQEGRVSLNERFRRPDVACEYRGRQLVFEIQLSYLTLDYMLGRHGFYAQLGAHIIWVLDRFEKDAQRAFEIDLKYLTPYEHYYRLDEDAADLRFLCDYKEVYLEGLELRSKWREASVGLADLHFVEGEVQPFFHDMPAERKRLEARLATLAEARRREREAEERRQLDAAISEALTLLREAYKTGRAWQQPLAAALGALTPEETDHLNRRLGFAMLDDRGIPFLHALARGIEKRPFLQDLLEWPDIDLDVHRRAPDGTTVFQEVVRNPEWPPVETARALLRRGYRVQPEDLDEIRRCLCLPRAGRPLALVYAMAELRDPDFDAEVAGQRGDKVDCAGVLLALYSIRDDQPRYYNQNNLVAIAHTVLNTEAFLPFAETILASFAFYGRWPAIEAKDRAGKLSRRVHDFRRGAAPRSAVLDPVLARLFPGLLLAPALSP